MQEPQVQSLGQEDPLEKEMAAHSRFLLAEFRGERNLVGYSPWGRKESDTTEQLTHTHTHTHTHDSLGCFAYSNRLGMHSDLCD